MKRKDKAFYDPRLFAGIAHRGLHDEKDIENGMRAFKNAIEVGSAFELDIHLTKDGQLAVIHDSSLKRVTGKEGIVEEKTLAELQEEYPLLNGEKIPSLRKVLSLNNERVPIVVELKAYQKNYKALAKAAMKELSSIKDSKSITLISFDPRALLCCKKSPFTRGLLIAIEHQWVFALRGFFDYLDVDSNLLSLKKVVSYRKKGNLVNAWTIDTHEKLIDALDKTDMITFQSLSLEDQALLRK